MLNLNSVMVGSMQVRTMGEFYEKVFARPADVVEEGVEYGWRAGNTFLMVGEHSAAQGANKEPGRVMFNFETDQVQDEFERIRTAGATVIQEPYEMAGMWIATFADPDGNYFQLMSPFENTAGQ
jgi:predicted enzyme related to lactoylglutathione lyase